MVDLSHLRIWEYVNKLGILNIDAIKDSDHLSFGKNIRDQISLSEDDEKVDTVTIDVPSDLLFLRIMKAAKETQIEVARQVLNGC
jgi:RNA binding exosome subunit